MTDLNPDFARKLFAQPCEFMIAAAAPDQLPPPKLPEVAFIGRSNVGKSSLINGLVNRKNLARASNTPGRTQQIVIFDLNKTIMLADLPGYGHAEAPRTVQHQWEGLVHVYLRKRRNLKCVYLLVDGRHGTKANDLAMMEFLDRAAVSYQVVLTKADQVRADERDNRMQQTKAVLARHPAARPEVFFTSAEKGLGLESVRESIAAFAAFAA
jgi:GTP-binding protein